MLASNCWSSSWYQFIMDHAKKLVWEALWAGYDYLIFKIETRLNKIVTVSTKTSNTCIESWVEEIIQKYCTSGDRVSFFNKKLCYWSFRLPKKKARWNVFLKNPNLWHCIFAVAWVIDKQGRKKVNVDLDLWYCIYRKSRRIALYQANGSMLKQFPDFKLNQKVSFC